MLEKTNIDIGFMALTDCAPLVIASELGFDRKWGLQITLHKQNSWATLRDRVHAGVLDAGQMLAPMPLASTLGLGGVQENVMTPFVLSRNGNAITISEQLRKEILAENKVQDISLPLYASLLNPVIKQRKLKGEQLKFATVYPYSCHYYQILSWLTSGRIDLEAIELLIIPPVQMVEALSSGQIDGFCVGGPWNAKAVRQGVGMTGLTSSDIWPDFPEKVLGIKEQWYEEYPNTTKALVLALHDACQWLEGIPNRLEAARILCAKQYLNTELDVVAPSLLGSCLTHVSAQPRHVPSYNQFSDYDKEKGNCPEHVVGSWLVNQMVSAGHLQQGKISEKLIARVYRADIYKEIMLKK